MRIKQDVSDLIIDVHVMRKDSEIILRCEGDLLIHCVKIQLEKGQHNIERRANGMTRLKSCLFQVVVFDLVIYFVLFSSVNIRKRIKKRIINSMLRVF